MFYLTRFITTIVFIFSINLAFSQKQPVSEYCFNGNSKDNSGNQHDGTVNGATLTTDRNGKPNSAYFFDGISNLINIPSAPHILENYTYSLWLNPSSIPSTNGGTLSRYKCLLSIGNSGADQQVLLSNNPSLGYGHVGLGAGGYTNNSSVLNRTTSNQLPSINTWYHLAYTRSDSTTKLFLNGQLVDSVSFSNASPKYNTPHVASIGSRFGSMQFFHGKIDDVKIYDYALTNNEINNLFNMASCADTCFLTVTDTNYITVYDTVRVTVYDTVIVYDTIHIETGITPLSGSTQIGNVVVFPNPSSDIVHLKFEQELTNIEVVLHDTRGSEVFRKKFKNTSNGVSLSLPSTKGVYILTLFHKNEIINKYRLVKK
ncbi:MAG: LamG-like jellyroll fold domain-containing protein [Salibacteraceae bacterium]